MATGEGQAKMANEVAGENSIKVGVGVGFRERAKKCSAGVRTSTEHQTWSFAFKGKEA